jgi:hypothetical protein
MLILSTGIYFGFMLSVKSSHVKWLLKKKSFGFSCTEYNVYSVKIISIIIQNLLVNVCFCVIVTAFEILRLFSDASNILLCSGLRNYCSLVYFVINFYLSLSCIYSLYYWVLCKRYLLYMNNI